MAVGGPRIPAGARPTNPRNEADMRPIAVVVVAFAALQVHADVQMKAVTVISKHPDNEPSDVSFLMQPRFCADHTALQRWAGAQLAQLTHGPTYTAHC